MQKTTRAVYYAVLLHSPKQILFDIQTKRKCVYKQKKSKKAKTQKLLA